MIVQSLLLLIVWLRVGDSESNVVNSSPHASDSFSFMNCSNRLLVDDVLQLVAKLSNRTLTIQSFNTQWFSDGLSLPGDSDNKDSTPTTTDHRISCDQREMEYAIVKLSNVGAKRLISSIDALLCSKRGDGDGTVGYTETLYLGWLPVFDTLLFKDWSKSSSIDNQQIELGGGSGGGFQVICDNTAVLSAGGGGGGGVRGQSTSPPFTAGGGGGFGIQILRRFLEGSSDWPLYSEIPFEWMSMGGGSGCGTCQLSDDQLINERCQFTGQILCGVKADNDDSSSDWNQNSGLDPSNQSSYFNIRSLQARFATCRDIRVVGGGGGGGGGICNHHYDDHGSNQDNSSYHSLSHFYSFELSSNLSSPQNDNEIGLESPMAQADDNGAVGELFQVVSSFDAYCNKRYSDWCCVCATSQRILNECLQLSSSDSKSRHLSHNNISCTRLRESMVTLEWLVSANCCPHEVDDNSSSFMNNIEFSWPSTEAFKDRAEVLSPMQLVRIDQQQSLVHEAMKINSSDVLGYKDNARLQRCLSSFFSSYNNYSISASAMPVAVEPPWLTSTSDFNLPHESVLEYLPIVFAFLAVTAISFVAIADRVFSNYSLRKR